MRGRDGVSLGHIDGTYQFVVSCTWPCPCPCREFGLVRSSFAFVRSFVRSPLRLRTLYHVFTLPLLFCLYCILLPCTTPHRYHLPFYPLLPPCLPLPYLYLPPHTLPAPHITAFACYFCSSFCHHRLPSFYHYHTTPASLPITLRYLPHHARLFYTVYYYHLYYSGLHLPYRTY